MQKDLEVKIEGNIKQNVAWALLANACNPHYSGGRDQEDHSSKPAWTNSS
jgi:hypothetical protein